MNKHISLVKKWLAGEDVTTEELRANSVDAKAAAHAGLYGDAAGTAAAEVAAAHAAKRAADAAATTDNAHYWATADNAHYWVKQYEELTSE